MRILWQQPTLPTFWPISSSETDRAFYGGITEASMVNNGTLSGGADAAGRTFIGFGTRQRIRQHGYIRTIKVLIGAVGTGTPIKFKLFRPTPDGYKYITETAAFLPGGTGVQTYAYTTELPCQPGDCIGVWLAGSSNAVRITGKSLAGSSYGYVADDVITTIDPYQVTVGADTVLNIEVSGTPPFLAITGDSIAEGHHTDFPWHGPLHIGSGPGGNPRSELGYWLRNYLGGSSMLEYQNMALGGQTFAWVVSTGIVESVATLPQAILIHCGTNDLAAGRTWAAVEADLDTIRAAVAGTIDLFINELLPAQGRNNTDAATSRTWNANLAAWCSANNAILISCHDAMGQIRTTTGYLDDLLDEYNYDDVHLTQSGVMRLAQLIGEAMQEFYG